MLCVLIADFKVSKLKDIPKYKTKWNIREEEYKDVSLTDKFEIIIIELDKLRNGYKDENQELIDWCNFIMNPKSITKSIIERNRYIKMANEELKKINSDEKERRLAELREKAILDEIAIRNTGYDEGKEEAKIEIAKNMLKENISINVISKVTGLSIEKVKNIMKNY